MTVTPARTALLVLATARLTRLVTTDWLGEWALVRPAKRWAIEHETHALEQVGQQLARGLGFEYTGRTPEAVQAFELEQYNPSDPMTWQAKLVKGLDCPFCVGFWIGGAVLAADAVLSSSKRRGRPADKLWALSIGALALNYVVGHLSSRVD